MPKFSANLTILFTDLPLLDRFAAAAKSGFKGVEYMSPYEETKADLVARLRDNGLTQVLHNLPAGDWAAGERGIAIFPDRVEEFRRGVAQAIDYAQRARLRPRQLPRRHRAARTPTPKRCARRFVGNLRLRRRRNWRKAEASSC